MKDNYYNDVKIGEGLIINGERLNHLKELEIKSGLDNLSEVTVTFYGKIDGLDNFPRINYIFDENIHKSNRKNKQKKTAAGQSFNFKVKGIDSPKTLSRIISRQMARSNLHFR
jgi:hypothetical protein